MPGQQQLMQTMLDAAESHMQSMVERLNNPIYHDLHDMLVYHMGWQNKTGDEARGKRIRPLVVLLTCAAAGGNWQSALPAAAAVELLHNFSLIHDDIEDNSLLRRGRPTVWAKWGIPQALNAGDTQLTLSHLALLEMQGLPPETLIHCARLLQNTCLALTQGQFLDIAFETRHDVSISDYWTMIEGKTATLLASCCGLGALIADVDQVQFEAYYKFGLKVGLAFQALDDVLGIWGDAALIGKSNESDLIARKKSLPILFGLTHSSDFAHRWMEGPIEQSDLPEIVELLEKSGAKLFTLGEADRLTGEAIHALADAQPRGEAGQALRDLAGSLLNRNF